MSNNVSNNSNNNRGETERNVSKSDYRFAACMNAPLCVSACVFAYVHLISILKRRHFLYAQWNDS